MGKFHLIGIKGAGMSALAQVLHGMGHYVQGSDRTTRFFTQKPLESLSIPLLEFNPRNILKLDPGFTVVASNAWPDEHPEISLSRKLGLRFYRYHEFLGELIRPFTSISVTGAHGKTTTAGLMAHVFEEQGPVARIIGDGTGSGRTGDKWFILESCEYRRHFLAYHPDYAVITNVDFDHPDYFRDFHDTLQAFQQMVRQVKQAVIACGDDPGVRMLSFPGKVLFYGLEPANDLRAYHVMVDEHGTSFDVSFLGNFLGRFAIPLHGDHNVLNALAVIGTAVLEKLDMERVADRLKTFSGVRRRFVETPLDSNILIDDYAHHPAEVTATIRAARDKYPSRRLVAVFQPHTYSRLEHFLDGFARALGEADEVHVCDVFGSVRESTGTVDVTDLLERLPGARHLSRENVGELNRYEDSVILFMGAGDIQKYQRWLLESGDRTRNVE
ncbi:UDP-N-acetylmuramate--L-alanine ligase [Staphylospora marina]|uniref:UDP-N-acetylmuramate--L-alanine ligase n=1 Tax=Staphylospora marina TaxID=2490858 RepID=UPI000F5BC19D|nr:UDP-N-acetylmuramate--L-alanine ligase [Staphylospora marina]